MREERLGHEPAANRPAGAATLTLDAHDLPSEPSDSYVVIRIATSYFRTEVRCPGVSSAGIALRISSPRR